MPCNPVQQLEMKSASVLILGLFVVGCAPVPTPVAKRVTIAKPGVAKTKQFAVPVLMYHRIDNLTVAESQSPLLRDLTVRPADFEEQIKFLVNSGYSVLLASDVERAVLEERELPEKAVCITLDDGYKDNFEQAFPILLKYRVPATIFLVTNNFGRPDRLSWDDVLEMRNRAGFGYGSHTVHHFDLATLDQRTLDFELAESKRLMEFKIQDPITSIAYPAGSYNDFVKERAKAAGYLAGWKKGGGPVTPGDDMLMLPRVRVSGRTTMNDFQRKVRATL